ncbi:dephospho-CoA kinase [Patescibacteria group bacterium]|nr:dephospho-CoA kinase [Patescibacteria group bacterium]
MICVGVTGYFGSGKTTALSYLKDFDFLCLDSDEIVHELYEPNRDGWKKINDFFGNEFLKKNNGPVNRAKLGKIVFNNPAKLRILEKIIHPLVYNEIQKVLQKNKDTNVAIEAIKFDENKLGKKIDYLIVVETDMQLAYKRFAEKRNLTFEQFKGILEAQNIPTNPDFVVKNNGSKNDLKKQIQKIAERIISQNS